MNRLRPYLTAFRIRALLETQYRGAALGGVITQAFFGLVYVCLYSALHEGGDQQALRETVTYVWLQQMFFRLMFAGDDDLRQQILSGSVAYTLCRPVDQHLYWMSRDVAQKVVGMLMRCGPMLLLQCLLPDHYRLALPHSPLALAQFLLGVVLGIACVAQIQAIVSATIMMTLDHRGAASVLSLIMMTFSGNVIPLTLFPDALQGLIRYQPFAQTLDAPIRMYLSAQPLPEWLLNTGVQAAWIVVLFALGRALWRRQLGHVTVQGG